jgi:hypothetical protein
MLESGMERPAFAPLAVGHEYCVLVTWANGSETSINNFSASRDARGWIERESENWLLLRPEAAIVFEQMKRPPA